MPLLTPNVPKGLIDLMKSLTKEVLRDKPENIYEYAAVHFEKQLCERDGSLDKEYELFTDYKASFEGQQQFLVPANYGFKCQRTPRGSGARRSKPDILASFKVLESIHEEDASAENLYSDEKYQKAIYVIQRYYRSYMARKKISASTDRRGLTEATAAIIIQRTMRKLFANKFPSRPAGETVRHGEVPQEDVDNVSEAASYTSSSTIQLLADSQEGRENRSTPGREEIGDDNGVGKGDGPTTTTTHEPSAASQDHHTVAAKEKQEVDRKSMDHENDESDSHPLGESPTNPLAAIVSDDTSTAPIGILSTKIGSNDQQNSLQTNTVEVAENGRNREPTHVQTPQDVARVEISLESQHSLGSTPETPPVAPPSRRGAEKTFAVRLQSNAFVDNNAGCSISSVGPNRKFAADTGDTLKAYSVFYQDGDDPDFSDSLNESTMEKDSLDTEDLDVDSLESNDNTSHLSGIVKRETMRVSDDGDACKDDHNEEQQNEQLLEMERVPSYLYGIHPKRTPLPERKSIQCRTAPDGENLGPDEKSEEESLESKESTSEESSATQIENILEPRIDETVSSAECKLEALSKPRSEAELNQNENDKKEANPPEVGKEDDKVELTEAGDVSNVTVVGSQLSSPSSSGVCSSSHDAQAKLGYFEALYNVGDTVRDGCTGHQDSEVESQLKDLRSLCNLYPGLEIKDIISEFHTKHIQPGQSGKESTYDDNNNVEDFEMKLSDTSAVDAEKDTEAPADLYKVDGNVEGVKSVAKAKHLGANEDEDDSHHSNANETIHKDVPKEEGSVDQIKTEVKEGKQAAAKDPSRDKNCVANAEGEIQEKKDDEVFGGHVSSDGVNELAKVAEASNRIHEGELVNSELSNETGISNFKEKQDNLTQEADGVYPELPGAGRKQATIDKDLLSSNSHEITETKADVVDLSIHENPETEHGDRRLDSKTKLGEDKAGDEGTPEEVELVKTNESTTEAKTIRGASESSLDKIKETFDDKSDVSAEPGEMQIDGGKKYGQTGNTEGEVIESSDPSRGQHETEEKTIGNNDVDSIQNRDGLEEPEGANEAKADKSIKVADNLAGVDEIKRSEHIESLDEIGESSEQVKGDGRKATDSLSEGKTDEIEERAIGTTGGSEQVQGDDREATDSLIERRTDAIKRSSVGTIDESEHVRGEPSETEEKTDAIEDIGTTGGSEQLKLVKKRAIGITGGSGQVQSDDREPTDSSSEGKANAIKRRAIGTTDGSDQVAGQASETEEKTDAIEDIGTTGGSEQVECSDRETTDSSSEGKTDAIKRRATATTDGSDQVRGEASETGGKTDAIADIGTTGGSEQVEGSDREATDSSSECKTDEIEKRDIGNTGGSEKVRGEASETEETRNATTDGTFAGSGRLELMKKGAIGTTGGSEQVRGEAGETEAKTDAGCMIADGSTGGSEKLKEVACESTDSLKAQSTDKEGTSSDVEINKANIPKEQELKPSLNETAYPTTDRNQSENMKEPDEAHEAKEEPIVEMKLDEAEGQLNENKNTESKLRSDNGDSLKESNESGAQIGERQGTVVEESSDQIVESQEKRSTKNTTTGGISMGGPKVIDSSENTLGFEAKVDNSDITGGSMQLTEGDEGKEYSADPKIKGNNHNSIESVIQGKSDAQLLAESNGTEDDNEETRLAETAKSSEVGNGKSVEMKVNLDKFGETIFKVAVGNSTGSGLEKQANLHEIDQKTEANFNMSSSNAAQETSVRSQDSVTNSVNVVDVRTTETDEGIHQNLNTAEFTESEATHNRDNEAELSEIIDDVQANSSSVTTGETSHDEDDLKNVNSIAEAADHDDRRNLVQDSAQPKDFKELVDSESKKSEEGLSNPSQLKAGQSDHFNDLSSASKEENPMTMRHLQQTQNKTRMGATGSTGVLRSFKGDSQPRGGVEKREIEEETDRSLTQNGAGDSTEETGLTGVLRSYKDGSHPGEVEKRETQEEADRSLTQNGADASIEGTGLTGVLRSFKDGSHPGEVEKRETQEEADRSLTQEGAGDSSEETGLTGVLRSFKDGSRAEASIEETGLTGVLRSFKGDSHSREVEKRETEEEAHRSLTQDGAKDSIEETGLTGVLRDFKGGSHPRGGVEKREIEEETDRSLTQDEAKDSIEETGLTGVLRSYKDGSHPGEVEKRETQEEADRSLTQDGAKDSIEETGLTGVLRSFKGDSHSREVEKRETEEEAGRSLTRTDRAEIVSTNNKSDTQQDVGNIVKTEEISTQISDEVTNEINRSNYEGTETKKVMNMDESEKMEAVESHQSGEPLIGTSSTTGNEAHEVVAADVKRNKRSLSNENHNDEPLKSKDEREYDTIIGQSFGLGEQSEHSQEQENDPSLAETALVSIVISHVEDAKNEGELVHGDGYKLLELSGDSNNSNSKSDEQENITFGDENASGKNDVKTEESSLQSATTEKLDDTTESRAGEISESHVSIKENKNEEEVDCEENEMSDVYKSLPSEDSSRADGHTQKGEKGERGSLDGIRSRHVAMDKDEVPSERNDLIEPAQFNTEDVSKQTGNEHKVDAILSGSISKGGDGVEEETVNPPTKDENQEGYTTVEGAKSADKCEVETTKGTEDGSKLESNMESSNRGENIEQDKVQLKAVENDPLITGVKARETATKSTEVTRHQDLTGTLKMFTLENDNKVNRPPDRAAEVHEISDSSASNPGRSQHNDKSLKGEQQEVNDEYVDGTNEKSISSKTSRSENVLEMRSKKDEYSVEEYVNDHNKSKSNDLTLPKIHELKEDTSRGDVNELSEGTSRGIRGTTSVSAKEDEEKDDHNPVESVDNRKEDLKTESKKLKFESNSTEDGEKNLNDGGKITSTQAEEKPAVLCEIESIQNDRFKRHLQISDAERDYVANENNDPTSSEENDNKTWLHENTNVEASSEGASQDLGRHDEQDVVGRSEPKSRTEDFTHDSEEKPRKEGDTEVILKETTSTAEDRQKDAQTVIISSKNPATTLPQSKEDQDKSISQADQTASGPSTEVTSVDENTAETSADFSSIGKDMDFFEDTIHYLKSATSQLTAIEGLFGKTTTDESANANTTSNSEENLIKAAVIIQSAIRGFRVRRAFQRNLSSERKKRVETEVASAIPVAIIHPTRHLADNEKVSNQTVDEQSTETQPEEENNAQHAESETRSEIPRLKRERPLEGKIRLDESVVKRTEAKIQPVKAESLEETQRAKPLLTREKPIERSSRPVKGDSSDETTRKESMRNGNTKDSPLKQKTPSVKERTKVPTSRVASSSNVPERQRLIKSKRDQFAKKGKSLSTNAQTQKPLVFDLEAIKKDLLSKKTVSQAGKKTRGVTRKDLLKGKDPSKRETGKVDKLNDSSVLDRSKFLQSRGSDKSDKVEKDSVIQKSNASSLDKERRTEHLANDGEMKDFVDLTTVERLIQEALTDPVEEAACIKDDLETLVQRQKDRLTNEFHEKSEKLSEQAIQDIPIETSYSTDISECKNVTSKPQTDPAADRADLEKPECLNEQSQVVKSGSWIKGMSQRIPTANPAAGGSSESLDTRSKAQVPESSTTALVDGGLDKDKYDVLTKPGIVTHHTTDSSIHSSAVVDTHKEDVIEDMREMTEKEVEETPTTPKISPNAQTEESLETDGQAFPLTDVVAGVDQITELESNLSKDHNGRKDDVQNSSTTQVSSTQQKPIGVKAENLSDKDLDSIKQGVATNENELKDLNRSKPSGRDETETSETSNKQLPSQSQPGSAETFQGDLNKPATMIQKTFRGYSTRKSLISRNAENRSGDDQENCKLTELHDSSTTGVDSTSKSAFDASATVVSTRSALKDVSQADSVKSNHHSQSPSSVECVESQKLDDSAVMIQKTFRGYKTRKALRDETKCQKENGKAMNEAAVVIQKTYKGYKMRRDLGGVQVNDREFRRGSDQSEDSPEKADTLLQKTYEDNQTGRDLGAFEDVLKRGSDHSEATREEAATLIQKVYKGYKTRLDLESSQQRHDDRNHFASEKDDTFEPSLNDNAAPGIHKSTSADALLESAAETIQKAYRDYHRRNDNSCNGVPIKSYSHGAQRGHACKEAVENSNESSIFMGPDTSFDLSDVDSVETKSEQVSDTATFTLPDESLSDAPSKTPTEEPQRDVKLQPERSSLSVESEIQRKRSIIEPTAPALEDILKSDEPSDPDSKPQWYVGDDLIVPTDAKIPSSPQQNSVDSTSSCRFDNSCSTDARLDISDKQPTPSIQSAVVSTSSLLFPNDADSDIFKQFTKPSRAVSADEEESSAREDEEKEKEIEENAQEQKLDADTARDGSGSFEKGEQECETVLGADPFSVVIKIEDLDGLPMDHVREIEAEVCKSCAEGMHGAGLTTASPRRKSIEEISREIDEQVTQRGDTKDADAAADSAEENLDKIKQFVLMEEANKANITESHTNDTCENISDNNCNKSQNDAGVAILEEPNKIDFKDASSDSKIPGIPSEGGKEEQEAFVESALAESGHESVEQSECPAITLIPPSSEDDMGLSESEANDGLPKRTERGENGDDVTGELRTAGIDASPSDEGATNDERSEKKDEQSGSTGQSEAIKVDQSDKVSDESEDHSEHASSTVGTKLGNDISPVAAVLQSSTAVKEIKESNKEARDASADLTPANDAAAEETPRNGVEILAVKALDESNKEARDASADLTTANDAAAEETPRNGVETLESFEIVDKDNSEKDPTDPLKEIEVHATPNEAGTESKASDEGVQEKMKAPSSSSHEIHLKNDDQSNKSTEQNNDDACHKKSVAEDQTEGATEAMLKNSLEMSLSEHKDSVSPKAEKSGENQSKATSGELTEDDCAPALGDKKTSGEQSEKLDACPSLELNKNDIEVGNVNSRKEHTQEQSQTTSERANCDPVQEESNAVQSHEKSSQDQEVELHPAEQNVSSTQEKSSVSEQKGEVQSPPNKTVDSISTLEANLEKLIDDSSPLTEKESTRVEPQSLPTENSSQEVVEEPCIKKVVPSPSDQEDSEIESTTTKAESTTTSVAYDEASENEALDSPPSLPDTLEKATEALRESEAVVARMHLRRDSEQKASLDHADQFPVFGDIACEPIKSMQELQKPSSPEVEDDIILQGMQREDTTRESSAQSESVIFGNSSSQLSESDDFFNDNVDNKSMHRMNTIAVDHGTYRAPNTLFKSVTIDDTVKYIDPEKSTEESGGSFCLDDALTADVRKKMMAYSVSEADSDYYEPGLDHTNRQHDDFNISTALNKFASSDTDTTIISAATKIQAGARGFLTRRRLRRASLGTRASLTDGSKASFGNDAIGESLDRLVEEEANKRLPKVHYQRQVGVNSLPSALGNAEEPEIVHSTPTRDELSTLTATTELLAPSSANTRHGEARYSRSMSTSSEYDVNGGIGASIDESSEALSSDLEATLAARRLTLQRGDAMRNDSTPDSDNGNDKQVEQTKITTANTDAILIHKSTLLESATTTNAEQRAHSDAAMVRKMEKIKWFAMRQNSMPVQIDSEVFRVLPKHMRKRIKSAEGQQKKRIRLPRD